MVAACPSRDADIDRGRPAQSSDARQAASRVARDTSAAYPVTAYPAASRPSRGKQRCAWRGTRPPLARLPLARPPLAQPQARRSTREYRPRPALPIVRRLEAAMRVAWGVVAACPAASAPLIADIGRGRRCRSPTALKQRCAWRRARSPLVRSPIAIGPSRDAPLCRRPIATVHSAACPLASARPSLARLPHAVCSSCDAAGGRDL